MKKLFACILMICLCVGAMLPAHAATAMSVGAEAVTVAPGEKFSVNIAVEENPGFAYLKIQLSYDEDIFTFHPEESVSTSDALILAAGETLISWDAGVNYTEEGTIGHLSFTASEAVSEGEYTIEITVVECYNLNTDDVQSVASNATVSIQTIQASSTIDSADMVLGTDIRVNYYAILDPSHVGAQMRFTMNGAETLVDGVATEDEGVYVYSFENLAPQCMGDNIKAELILGDAILDVEEEYSVKTYCENTLSQSAAELGMSAEKYAAMRTLIADMLEYGAKAQVYLNYKTDSLVNEGVTEQSEFVALNPEDCDEILEQSGNFTLTGVEFVSAGVYFDYYNALYVKFKAPNVTDSNFRVRLKDGEENILATYKLSECELISEESSTYVLVLPALSATQFEDFYIIELCKYTSRATTMQWSLNYGVSSYVCAKQNKTDAEGNLTPMAELARATYNYGLSASAYNAIAN